jgi:hypothetical protein
VRVFQELEVKEALECAAGGGQALHLHRIILYPGVAPRCFVEAIERGENIAHLFDQNAERLVRTARGLGVRVVVIERRGERRQHVDLCGGPLRRAVFEASRGGDRQLMLFGGGADGVG